MVMFFMRTLEAIDTQEQAHKGSVDKIVNLKGLLKSPWTLMYDVCIRKIEDVQI